MFPENDKKNIQINILNVILINYWLIGLFGLSFLIFAVQKGAVAILIIVYFSFLLLVEFTKRKGQISLASNLLVIGIWMIITFACLLAGTVINAFSCWYISLTIIVGLLLGKKSALFYSLITIFTSFLILFLNSNGYLDNPFFPVPPLVSIIVFIIAFAQSISPISLAIQNLRSVSEDLEQKVSERTKELELANKDLELFTYSLSHDLRNPLETIENLVSLIEQDHSKELSDQTQELIARVSKNSKRMNTLTKNLLQYFSLNHENISKQPVKMNTIIETVLENFKEELTAKKFQLIVNKVPDCLGDPLLLTEVWINLISNAVKYSINREIPEIEINFRKESESSIYYIRDNGIGIEKEKLPSLFKPFRRLHTDGSYEGFGIGLAFVQAIITKHGGKIWAESIPKEGTIINFTLN